MSLTPTAPEPVSAEPVVKSAQNPGECDRQIHAHFYLVEQIARKMHRRLPRAVQLDDLRGDGTLGLLAAARSFETARGVSFATFASYRIRGAMIDGLRAMDWVPKSRRGKLRNETAALRTNPGTAPTSLGSAVSAQTICSLDLLFRSEPTLRALRDHTTMPDARLEGRDTLATLFRQLPGNARRVIYWRWIKGLEQQEIARRWSVSQARISILHARAMQLLTKMCGHAHHT